jgi:hypothetical protein
VAGNPHAVPGDRETGTPKRVGDPDRDDMAPGDEAPPGAPEAGEDICPECSGAGRVDGEPCELCAGSGRVHRAVGGG